MRAKKYLKRLGLALLITCAVILVTLEVISRGAAQIFNHAMANQDMLRGTITVERLISDITGHVYFTNLVWTDREGNPILEIPSGDFRVNIWGRPHAQLQVDDDPRAHGRPARRLRAPLGRHESRLRAPLARHG